MITLHWTTCAAIGAMATGVFLGLKTMAGAAEWDFMSGPLGCGIILLAALIAACFLLIRAWGWV